MGDDIRNGVWAAPAGRGMRSSAQAPTGSTHRLPVVQDLHAIGVGEVVGDFDRLLFVLLIANIVACDPGAGLAVRVAPIPKVKTLLDPSPIRLAPAALNPDAHPCYRRISSLTLRAMVFRPPRMLKVYAQRLPNIHAQTGINKGGG